LGLACSTDVYAKELTVATSTSFVPFEFRKGDTYVGFDIDLLKALTKDVGVKYKLQVMDFNGIIPALQTGQIDMAVAGILISPTRAKVVDFSHGYYTSGYNFVVRENSKIGSLDDLRGKILGLITGGTAIPWAKKNLPDTKVMNFPSLENAYLALLSGRIDAVVGDTPTVQYYVKHGGAGKAKIVGPQVLPSQYGIAFTKGSVLVSKFNEALAHIKASGEYAKLYEKWFGVKPPKE
jgi:glutamine transport system substrate-binding protein